MRGSSDASSTQIPSFAGGREVKDVDVSSLQNPAYRRIGEVSLSSRSGYTENARVGLRFAAGREIVVSQQ
jgi:hypothetical protein